MTIVLFLLYQTYPVISYKENYRGGCIVIFRDGLQLLEEKYKQIRELNRSLDARIKARTCKLRNSLLELEKARHK